MAIQKEIHVCLIHATMTHSVQFQDQVSIVRVPLVGRVKDARVGTEKLLTETLKNRKVKLPGKSLESIR